METTTDLTTFDVEIPYRAYWSTPFCKWQGSMSSLNSIEFAAWVAKLELAARDISANEFDHCVLGTTVPQKHSFYGAPWLMGMLGAKQVGGPTIAQACATGVRVLLAAAREIQSRQSECALLVTADRCSNGPHMYYPNPKGPGGTGEHENWVMDNFSCDPLGRHAMLDTAENVARKYAISTEQQHELVLRRREQYDMAVATDRAFQKAYMTLPFPIPRRDYKKMEGSIEGDEGIAPSTPERLADLRPVRSGGCVTVAAQTHPADGNTALILASPAKAQALSRDPSIRIRLMGFGSARVDLAYMPEATVPAARQALKSAQLDVHEIHVFKSHNPFAVNDIVFCKQMGIDEGSMNNYGCSLIWGHPQGPTALRSVIEMIEELVLRGGGYGLFQGCAAGDTAMASVIRVENRH